MEKLKAGDVSYTPPDPGKGWRLLKVGERIPSGIVYFDADMPKLGWQKTLLAGKTYEKHEKVACGMFFRIRKPTKTKPDGWKVARAMARANTIHEARGIFERAVGK